MADRLRYTLRRLASRPLRTFLASLQVALGIWAVALILSANMAMHQQIRAAADYYGKNLAAVTVGTETIDEDGSIRRRTVPYFALEHLATFQASENIRTAYIAETLSRSFEVKTPDSRYLLQGLVGASVDFLLAAHIEILSGHPFSAADIEQGNRVILLSQTVAQELFVGPAVGQILVLQDARLSQLASLARTGSRGMGEPLEFEVIGVYRDMDSLQTVFVEASHAIIPLGAQHQASVRLDPNTQIFSTGQSDGQSRQGQQGTRQSNPVLGDHLDAIVGTGAGSTGHYRTAVITATDGRVHAATEDIRWILAAELDDSDEEVFFEYLRDRQQDLFSTVNRIIIFFAAFGLVAVTASSVGILSLMMVSVAEKTHDIGLHRALGATRRWIAVQFLSESVLLSCLGALLGLIMAAVSARWVLGELLLQAFWSDLVPFTAGLHPWAILVSLGLAVITGLLFGLYPAHEAASLPPVEAMREV